MPGLDHVEQIAVGLEHACALRDDGSVWCWGQGRAGQLGPSANGITPTPVRVAVPPSIRLALGNEPSCAEQASGSVWCWGTFLTGAGGPYPPTVRVQPRRQSVFGAHGPMRHAAVDIAAGGRSACLIDKQKHLTCWSFGDRADQQHLLGAEDLPGKVKSVALGRDYVCALLESGRVACWGDGYAGQLGDGGVFDGSRPVRVAGLRTRPTWRSDSASRAHSGATEKSGAGVRANRDSWATARGRTRWCRAPSRE